MSDEAAVGRLVSLAGRTALVTGGGGGIGGAVASLFHSAGARVVSADLPGREAGRGIESVACDVGDEAGVRALFEALRAKHERLDIVVHCAGIRRDAVLWKTTREDWAEVLRVNLDSAFLLLRECAPWMREKKDGSIVLVASINGERGKFGQSNYAASKAGLIGLAKTAARELGRFGIRVNVVSPGMIETPMTTTLLEEVKRQAAEESVLGRLGQPEDVARAALFLASPLARHVTGQVLRVDGGQLIA